MNRALEGVRAVLIDIDGTLSQAGSLIVGASDALGRLEAAGIAYRFVTNTTSRPRSTLVGDLRAMGLDIDPERIFTSPLAALDHLQNQGWHRCHFLVRDELLEDFAGIEPVDDAPDAVVAGDLGDQLTFERLTRAFRMLLDGVGFVTMGRNRYFMGKSGLEPDVGAFVAMLEYASARTATLVGKPAPAFFRRALESLDAEPSETAVIGDDLEGDVGGAQAAGMRGILVRTGKFREDELARSSIRPDAILPSLAHL